MIDDVKGLAFPFRIDPATGGLGWTSGHDKLRQNVRVILSTRVGERPMLRDFGTRIPSLVHDPNDDVLADAVQTQAREALLQWEPRILITATRIERAEEDGELSLRLGYIHVSEPQAGQMLLSLT
jgi:hypothetical protein